MEPKRASKRTSINGVRNVLRAKNLDPNFHYRVVNDVDDRVAEFQEFGYEIETKKDVAVGDKRVANPSQQGSPVVTSVGRGIKGVLMKKPKDLKAEDDKIRDAEIASTEEAILQPMDGGYGKVEIHR